jgi:hypothetical protein
MFFRNIKLKPHSPFSTFLTAKKEREKRMYQPLSELQRFEWNQSFPSAQSKKALAFLSSSKNHLSSSYPLTGNFFQILK